MTNWNAKTKKWKHQNAKIVKYREQFVWSRKAKRAKCGHMTFAVHKEKQVCQECYLSNDKEMKKLFQRIQEDML